MPYTITGCDSAGERHDYLMDDAGVITGDALLVDWLAANPLPAREGETPTDTEIDEVRQHVSKLLTVVQIGPTPPAPPEIEPQDAAPRDPPALAPAATHPTHPRYTVEELDILTVADLREFAMAAQIPGTSHMLKAELIAALLAQQGG